MDLNLKARQKSTLSPRLKYTLATRIKLATLLTIPEHNFMAFLRTIEENALFRKLSTSGKRVITCRRFPGTAFSHGFCELKEGINRDTGNFDVESLLQNHGALVSLIRDVGREKFEELFLYNEGNSSPREITAACGLSENDVARINDFVNELSLHSEFYYPSRIGHESHHYYQKVASIEKDSDGKLSVKFFSPHYCRGKYRVDAEKLESLKKEGYFSREELKELHTLMQKIDLANERKSVVYHLLEKTVEKQSRYLLTGKERDLVPYTQKELAGDLSLDRGLVSRAMGGRSVDTPHNGERPLKSFFPNRKYLQKLFLREIAGSDDHAPLTDNAIAAIFKRQYNITLSRRTICAYRKELKISSLEGRENER